MLDPELKARIGSLLDSWFEKRIPIMVRDRLVLQYRWRGDSVTVLERRPGYRDRTRWTTSPVARFRREPKSRLWSLDWRDRNGRWHVFEHAPPSRDFERVLAVLDEDAKGIFWG